MVDVQATQALPIDGEWIISTIKKRIRIDGGRAYAVDPWLHMFVLKIEPLMVVIQDIERTGSGEYTGKDLPLLGEWKAQLQANGQLKVDVAGAFGPVTYQLIPVNVDDREAFAMDLQTPGFGADAPIDDSGEYSVTPPDDESGYPSEWNASGSEEPEPIAGEPQVNPDEGKEKVTPW
jgi:hypothetical protein